jgi:hypothetical protein
MNKETNNSMERIANTRGKSNQQINQHLKYNEPDVHRSKAPNYLGAQYSPAGAADRGWLTRSSLPPKQKVQGSRPQRS